jgi:hypothetical protein
LYNSVENDAKLAFRQLILEVEQQGTTRSRRGECLTKSGHTTRAVRRAEETRVELSDSSIVKGSNVSFAVCCPFERRVVHQYRHPIRREANVDLDGIRG